MFRKTIKIISIVITIIVLACFLTACCASWISPRTTILPTYFVMIMPIWILLMTGIAIFWLCMKKWITAIALFIIILGTFPQWRNVVTINFPLQNHNGTSVSILTYNIHLFQNQHKFKEIVGFIKDADADIVCLQEFGFYEKLGYSQKEILDAFDAIYPYRHIWYKNQNKTSQNGLATFSKYPIVKKKKIEYASANNISIYSDIVINNDTIKIINNHLESNKLNYKDREIAKIITDENSSNKEILSASRHISSKLSTGARSRAKQAEAIRKIIDETNYSIIVAGDFNDVPESYTYQKIKGNLQDAYSMAGQWGYHWTYYENHMLFFIDHIFIDKKFSVINSKIHKVTFSDHYPLSAKIIIK